MFEFKIGDRVRLIGNRYYDLVRGGVYTVKSIRYSGFFGHNIMEVYGGKRGYDPKYFELAPNSRDRGIEISEIFKKQIEYCVKYPWEVYTINSPCKINSNKLKPKRVIFNPPATIVFWDDGTKTIVKKNDEEKEYDIEKAVLYAFFRKQTGMSKTQVCKYFEGLKEEYSKQREVK